VLTITEAKASNGILSNLELSQQRAAVLAVEAAIPQLEQQEREARYALALLLGLPPEGFDIKGQSLTGISAPDIQPGLPSELLTRRPDVAAAEANLASAHASVDAARALWFPQIGLTGSGGFASGALGSLFNPTSMLYSVGASLAQTIFDGGAIASQNDLARGKQQELVATYRKTVLNAFIDTESALGDVQSFREQDRLRTQQVAAAQEAFRISELQYREGVADLLAVLQTQQALFSAQDVLVQIRLAELQSKVGLYRALGGGWISSDAPMPAEEIDFEDRPDNAPKAETRD
jgi:NodT family efflux transporter outer membrane factor (OMF) lipoprotein